MRFAWHITNCRPGAAPWLYGVTSSVTWLRRVTSSVTRSRHWYSDAATTPGSTTWSITVAIDACRLSRRRNIPDWKLLTALVLISLQTTSFRWNKEIFDPRKSKPLIWLQKCHSWPHVALDEIRRPGFLSKCVNCNGVDKERKNEWKNERKK